VKAEITDVVLRDGLQDEPVLVSIADRCRLANALADAGLRTLEVVSFVSGHRVPQMRGAEEFLGALPRRPDVRLYGLALNQRGARRAIGTGLDELRLAVSASIAHSSANAGRSTDQALEEIAAAVEELTAEEPELHLVGAVATAFICPEDGPVPAGRLLGVVRRFHDMGLRHVNLADTLGTATPEHVARSVASIRDAFADLDIGLHLHDADGRVMASVDATMALGIRKFDSSLGGLGGCPFASGAHGNTATEALVTHLHRGGVATGIDEDALRDATALLRDVLDRSPRLDGATRGGQ
jgi:hydroxymethylglutaryl-CoA lyase